MNSVKGIIFDYGGTIDTNGIHWGELIWEQYRQAGAKISHELYREAYVHGERTLGKQRIIEPTDTFHRLLEKKTAIQFDYLKANTAHDTLTDTLQQQIVERCYTKAKETIAKNCEIVKAVCEKRRAVLVTNFYGNMPVVLKEFALDNIFGTIVESSIVGIRKPDPRIFSLGVEAMQLPPEEVVVIGDSYKKDIYPALSIGCKTVWLKKVCWEEESIIPGYEPTAIIESLEELPTLMLQS